MEQWENKIAVVTGASSGIGAAIVKDLVRAGVKTIGLARRVERVEKLKDDLEENHAKLLYAYKCDVCDEKSVKEAFKWIVNNFSGVNILVNNAGIAKYKPILSDDLSNEEIRSVVETNILGVLYCTKEAYKQMKENDAEGYIININSYIGHCVPNFNLPFFNIYPGTKHAITATTEVLRQELNYFKNKKVRVTSISPGYVETEIEKAGGVAYDISSDMPILKSEDISNAVLYVLGTPSRVSIKEIIIKPTGESA